MNLHTAIRLPLRLVPRTAAIPTLTGPNRGLRWVVEAGNHGHWIGWYERDIARKLASIVQPGWACMDVGAHSGYFTLAMSRLVGPDGKVIALEPHPKSFRNLTRHIAINKLANCQAVEAAASSDTGASHLSDNWMMSQVGQVGFPIKTVRLDDFPTPDFIKMDIEGAEYEALQGAARILSECRTRWLIELHRVRDYDCIQLLKRSRYGIETLGPTHIFASPQVRAMS